MEKQNSVLETELAGKCRRAKELACMLAQKEEEARQFEDPQVPIHQVLQCSLPKIKFPSFPVLQVQTQQFFDS